MSFAAMKPIHAQTLQLLLVEDDPSDTALTKIALDASGTAYKLHTLSSGADVLPYMTEWRKPDILLLDLSLPGKDGFEVLAELSSQPSRFGSVSIVILTGDTHCAFLTHSYGLNIAAYLTKPCTCDKIRSALVAVNRQKNHPTGHQPKHV